MGVGVESVCLKLAYVWHLYPFGIVRDLQQHKTYGSRPVQPLYMPPNWQFHDMYIHIYIIYNI